MGQEAACRVRVGREVAEGRAQLEKEEILFRGGKLRLRIPFRDIKTVTARRGRLDVVFADGRAAFELGPAAEKWAFKIRYPRSLVDKLGVKPGARVSVLGIGDEGFRAQLAARTAEISEGRLRRRSNIVLLAAENRRDLGRLEALRGSIEKDGAIWVVWPKGRKELREDDVRAAGSLAGLVDVKVVSFSDTLSALKLVIPVRER